VRSDGASSEEEHIDALRPVRKELVMSKVGAAAGSEENSSGSLLASHPNASVALGSGSGLGALVVWAVGLTGMTMPPEVAAAIAGVIAALALFVGHRGIKGAASALWRGDRVAPEARTNAR
jgi:hypothetical protein